MKYEFLLEIVQREGKDQDIYRVVVFVLDDEGAKMVEDILEIYGSNFAALDVMRKSLMKRYCEPAWQPKLKPAEFRTYWAEMKIVVQRMPAVQLDVLIGRHHHKVNTLDEAALYVRNVILNKDWGARDFPGAIVYRDQKKVARVHYNGMVEVQS